MSWHTPSCRKNKISSRIIEDVICIVNNAKTAPDRVNLAELWRGKMRRIEKLRKWIKSLIKQNWDNLNEFSLEKFIEPNTNIMEDHTSPYNSISTNLNDPNSLDGLDTIEVTLDDLFIRLTTDWIVPTREDYEEERKRIQENENWNKESESKENKESNENNKIILKI